MEGDVGSTHDRYPGGRLMALVEGERLWKEYSQGGEKIVALQDISLQIDPGEFVVITGESGSGKSTLLALLGTLERPTRGTVRFLGRTVDALTAAQLDEIRRKHIGFVFQDFLLVRHLSAFDNVRLPALLSGGWEAERAAEALIERFHMSRRRSQRPGALSRGEMQRIALARALINRPQILLADEPTANLDRANAETIWAHLGELNRSEGLAVVVATHNPDTADHATRVVRLADGAMVTDESHR